MVFFLFDLLTLVLLMIFLNEGSIFIGKLFIGNLAKAERLAEDYKPADVKYSY